MQDTEGSKKDEKETRLNEGAQGNDEQRREERRQQELAELNTPKKEEPLFPVTDEQYDNSCFDSTDAEPALMLTADHGHSKPKRGEHFGFDASTTVDQLLGKLTPEQLITLITTAHTTKMATNVGVPKIKPEFPTLNNLSQEFVIVRLYKLSAWFMDVGAWFTAHGQGTIWKELGKACGYVFEQWVESSAETRTFISGKRAAMMIKDKGFDESFMMSCYIKMTSAIPVEVREMVTHDVHTTDASGEAFGMLCHVLFVIRKLYDIATRDQFDRACNAIQYPRPDRITSNVNGNTVTSDMGMWKGAIKYLETAGHVVPIHIKAHGLQKYVRYVMENVPEEDRFELIVSMKMAKLDDYGCKDPELWKCFSVTFEKASKTVFKKKKSPALAANLAREDKKDEDMRKKVCNRWARDGHCPNKEHCRFGHQDKFKGMSSNTVCLNWQQTKSCRWGDNCRFLHRDTTTATPATTTAANTAELEERVLQKLWEKIHDPQTEIENSQNTATAAKGICDKISWYLDTGANVPVVGSFEDDSILEVLEEDTALRTASGLTKVRKARLNTPFGETIGIISPGAPRLIPAHYILKCGGTIQWMTPSTVQISLMNGAWKGEIPAVDGIPRIPQTQSGCKTFSRVDPPGAFKDMVVNFSNAHVCFYSIVHPKESRIVKSGRVPESALHGHVFTFILFNFMVLASFGIRLMARVFKFVCGCMERVFGFLKSFIHIVVPISTTIAYQVMTNVKRKLVHAGTDVTTTAKRVKTNASAEIVNDICCKHIDPAFRKGIRFTSRRAVHLHLLVYHPDKCVCVTDELKEKCHKIRNERTSELNQELRKFDNATKTSGNDGGDGDQVASNPMPAAIRLLSATLQNGSSHNRRLAQRRCERMGMMMMDQGDDAVTQNALARGMMVNQEEVARFETIGGELSEKLKRDNVNRFIQKSLESKETLNGIVLAKKPKLVTASSRMQCKTANRAMKADRDKLRLQTWLARQKQKPGRREAQYLDAGVKLLSADELNIAMAEGRYGGGQLNGTEVYDVIEDVMSDAVAKHTDRHIMHGPEYSSDCTADGPSFIYETLKTLRKDAEYKLFAAPDSETFNESKAILETVMHNHTKSELSKVGFPKYLWTLYTDGALTITYPRNVRVTVNAIHALNKIIMDEEESTDDDVSSDEDSSKTTVRVTNTVTKSKFLLVFLIVANFVSMVRGDGGVYDYIVPLECGVSHISQVHESYNACGNRLRESDMFKVHESHNARGNRLHESFPKSNSVTFPKSNSMTCASTRSSEDSVNRCASGNVRYVCNPTLPSGHDVDSTLSSDDGDTLDQFIYGITRSSGTITTDAQDDDHGEAKYAQGRKTGDGDAAGLYHIVSRDELYPESVMRGIRHPNSHDDPKFVSKFMFRQLCNVCASLFGPAFSSDASGDGPTDRRLSPIRAYMIGLAGKGGLFDASREEERSQQQSQRNTTTSIQPGPLTKLGLIQQYTNERRATQQLAANIVETRSMKKNRTEQQEDEQLQIEEEPNNEEEPQIEEESNANNEEESQHEEEHEHNMRRSEDTITYEQEIERITNMLTQEYGAQRIKKSSIELNKHKECKHTEYNNECEVCVRNNGRMRSHQTNKNGDKRTGVMAVDLTSLGTKASGGQVLIAVGYNLQGQRYTIATPMDSKHQNEIRKAVAKTIVLAENRYGAGQIKRVHSDCEVNESTRMHLEQHMAVELTNTGGHNPASNGWAECGVKQVCQRAKAVLDHLGENAKQSLWRDAMVYAAISLSPPDGVDPRDIPPFGTAVNFTKRVEKRGKLEATNVQGIYLYPTWTVSNGSVCMPTSKAVDGTVHVTEGQRENTDFVTLKKVDGVIVRPSVRVNTTTRLLAQQTTILGCKLCGKMRPVTNKTARKSPEVVCEELKGITCETPENKDGPPIPRRRGRPVMGHVAEVRHRERVKNAAQEIESQAQRMTSSMTKGEMCDVLNETNLTEGEDVEHELACTAFIQDAGRRMVHKQNIGEWEVVHIGCTATESGIGDDDDAEACRAFVTRPCTKEEMSEESTMTARKKEVASLVSRGAWNPTPIEKQKIADIEGATYCGMMVLDSVKHSERSRDEWKKKSRAVVRGDDVRNHKGERASTIATRGALWCPVTSLDGARCVMARAVREGWKLWSIDIATAYLQVAWPKSARHYIRLPREVVDCLSPAQQALHYQLKQPMYLMEKCIYGHPQSGFLWVEDCLSVLKKAGFRHFEGEHAMLTCDVDGETVVLCVYVDDILATGSPKALQFLWDTLAKVYEYDEPQEVYVFLGMQLDLVYTAAECVMTLNMCEYAKSIVCTYEQLYGENATNVHFPINKDVRACLSDHDESQTASKSMIEKVRKLIGMCLWLHRCSRIDIGYACSMLAGRITSWNAECDRELKRLVSFINYTANYGLVYNAPRGQPVEWHVEVQSDADLRAPRSQSGYVCGAVNRVSTWHQYQQIVSWGSKKQSITADSVAIAEVIAQHYSLKQCMTLVDMITGVHDSDMPIVSAVDNSQCLSLSTTGFSSKIMAYGKSIGLKAALVHDLKALGCVQVIHVPSKFNKANILTKALAGEHLAEACLSGVVEMGTEVSKIDRGAEDPESGPHSV